MTLREKPTKTLCYSSCGAYHLQNTQYGLAFSLIAFFFLHFLLQLSSMGMMTEYYHFFFTTLVRKKNAQLRLLYGK